MEERTEYWWVRHDSEIQPAEVGFVGGIPVHFRFLGTAGRVKAETAELIERLPAPPTPVFRPQAAAPAPAAGPKRSGSLLWFIGILLLIFVVQCSGQIYDAIK
jgi:hypothetical protein